MLQRLHRLVRTRLPEERGSVIILVALSMTAIIGLAAMGTDVGRLYVERQRLVTVADAAALTGAHYLPYDPTNALLAARSNLQKNGYNPTQASVVVTPDGREMEINLNRQVPMTFARVFGPDKYEVTGGASARTTNLNAYIGAAPLGVPRADWKIGEKVTLKMDAQDGYIAPGNYQALALGKSGASMYEQNLMTGYGEWIRVDQWVATETGNMAGPTVRAVNYRITQDPNSSYTSVTRQSPRLVVVPILEDYAVNGRGEVHVIGFGVFYLENAFDHGNNRGEIVGRFLRLVVEGEGSETAPDFGARVTKLVR